MADDAKAHHLVDAQQRVREFLPDDGGITQLRLQMTKGASHAKRPFSVLYARVLDFNEGVYRYVLR
jgi:hypothetical protein